MSADRYVTCIHCAHALSWLAHTALRFAVDCPRCGAKKQFGPDVYVRDFHGYTLRQVLSQKESAAARLGKEAPPGV